MLNVFAKIKVNIDSFYCILAGISMFALTRQGNISGLSSLLIPVSGLYLILLTVKGFVYEKNIAWFYFSELMLACPCFIALWQNNFDINKVLRFLLILTSVNIAFFVKNIEGVFKIALFFLRIQAVFVILVSLICFFRPEFSILFNEICVGSIFPANGIYMVQLLGNALIPLMALIFSAEAIAKHKNFIDFALFFIATFLCGNVAYIIALIVFCIGMFILENNTKSMLVVFLLTIVFSLPTFNYLESRISSKMKSNNISLKSEQITILLNDFLEKPYSLIIGNGLGNQIEYNGFFRTYKSNIYFEMQSFYIMNQLGLPIFGIFVIVNLLIAYKCFSIKLFFCYLFYLILSSVNPYIFDLNHFWAIIILKNYDYSNLLNIKF